MRTSTRQQYLLYAPRKKRENAKTMPKTNENKAEKMKNNDKHTQLHVFFVCFTLCFLCYKIMLVPCIMAGTPDMSIHMSHLGLSGAVFISHGAATFFHAYVYVHMLLTMG